MLAGAPRLRSLRLGVSLGMDTFALCSLFRQLTALNLSHVGGIQQVEPLNAAVRGLTALRTFDLRFYVGEIQENCPGTVPSGEDWGHRRNQHCGR